MGRYSKLQFNHLKTLNNQVEARLTRTTIIALVNEWRQTQHMRTYQSEYDRIRNELSKSALPCQTQEGLQNRRIELEQMGAKIYSIIS